MAKDELFSGESKNIEYKVVVPDKSEKYMKTVVAFANTQGGRLVIGIDDKTCLLYTSPSPGDRSLSRMPSSA